MFTRLHIEGLKGFARREEVRLAPITLVFGANSAGKSSLLQALLLLKQTLDTSADATLRMSGDLVDLGGYANLVHGHDVARSLRLGIELSGEGGRRYGLSLGFGCEDGVAAVREIDFSWITDAQDVALRAVARSDKHARDEVTFEALVDEQSSAPLGEWLAGVLGPRLKVPSAWTFCREQAIAEAELAQRGGAAWDGFDREVVLDALANIGPRLHGGAPGELAAMRWLPTGFDVSPGDRSAAEKTVLAAVEAVLADASEQLRKNLAGVVHLGPAREIPARIFSLREMTSQGRRIVEDPGLVASVNAHLERLEVPYQLDPVRVGQGDPLVEDAVALQLIDTRYAEPLRVNIADVGVGISQLLPFLTAAVANVHGTVLVEQPELHVHPALQMQLGAVVAAEADTTQFILETHSEHLMLRLLRYVRNEQLDPSDIAVLYVEHVDDEGARIHQMKIDEAGEFVQRWPGGFFTEREDELLSLDEPAPLP